MNWVEHNKKTAPPELEEQPFDGERDKVTAWQPW